MRKGDWVMIRQCENDSPWVPAKLIIEDGSDVPYYVRTLRVTNHWRTRGRCRPMRKDEWHWVVAAQLLA